MSWHNTTINEKPYSKGISLVEVIIGSSVLAIVVIGLVYVTVSSLALNRQALARVNASLLAEEGFEAARFMRDGRWSNISDLTLDDPYGINWNGTVWGFTNDPTTYDGFTRSITFSEVLRDANDNIAESGTEDDRSRKVTVSVAWNLRGTTYTETFEGYLFDIFND